MSSTFILDDAIRSDPVCRTRSLCQGDPSAPAVFNCVLDDIAEQFCRKANEKNWGIKLGGGQRLSLLLFADNFWLVATSPRELAEMSTLWMTLLSGAGWQAPIQEMTWCTTASDAQNFSVEVSGVRVHRALRSVGFKALGVQITFDNQFTVELKRRIKSAWHSFYKYMDILCCKSAPIAKHLKLLAISVDPALFWCAGSWNPTKAQLQTLRGVQQSMVRKMLGRRRQVGESLEECMRKINSQIRNLFIRHGVERWDAKYYGLYFTWAGDVARISINDPERLTYQALVHKDIAWIHKIADQFHGNQLHGRKLHTWRWERLLIKYDSNWKSKALDKQSWSRSLNDMIVWRCNYI